MNAIQLLILSCLAQGMRPSDILLEAETSGYTREETLSTLATIKP